MRKITVIGGGVAGLAAAAAHHRRALPLRGALEHDPFFEDDRAQLERGDTAGPLGLVLRVLGDADRAAVKSQHREAAGVALGGREARDRVLDV